MSKSSSGNSILKSFLSLAARSAAAQRKMNGLRGEARSNSHGKSNRGDVQDPPVCIHPSSNPKAR